MATHFAWMRDMKGRLSPQLWSENFATTKPHTPIRSDLMRQETAHAVKVVALRDDEADITLDEAALRYPAPVPA